jgi:hypothetical protein
MKRLSGREVIESEGPGALHLQIFNGLSLRSSIADLIVFMIDCVSVDVLSVLSVFKLSLWLTHSLFLCTCVYFVPAGSRVIL